MIFEEQRFIHEDLERLEQAIADRVAEEPRNIRDRLARDHEVAHFLKRIEDQSKRLLDIYKDADGAREKEIQTISTGDQFEEFYKQLDEIKDFHRRYPNEPVENLERAYKRRQPGEGEVTGMEIDNLFTGEEGYGQFLDLTTLHEDYLNLPGVKRLSYVQYLDIFDAFTPPQLPIKRNNKLSDRYFKYVGELANYLESFIKKVKPLQDLDKLFASFDEEFERQWAANEVPGWTEEAAQNGTQGPKTEGSGEGIWCADCEREFKNENVYKNHLTGKKHIRAAEARKAAGDDAKPAAPTTNGTSSVAHRLKERAVAEREHRVRSLTQVLQPERQATRFNVERRQGMTERERQMELEALLNESENPGGDRAGDQSDEDDEDRIYNPLKLPLAWDGKPIPYWLYKLHGLGVEYPCEICGNFVYMGRRAFDKHFSEALHIFGLKCLGITSNTNLFREITRIEDAIRLWEKLEQDRKKDRDNRDNVVQMEDAEGNVMPERIYLEVLKAAHEAKVVNPDIRAVLRWFAQNEKRIRDKDTDQLALLSCMFPEKRTDRVYWLQDTSLVKIIARCLLLGCSRRQELERWRISGGVDLGQCVENVMRQAENHVTNGQDVTVEEIDKALTEIASRCKFSGPQVRRQRTAVKVDQTLSPLYRRLSSRDAKWLTRMILKSYSPVSLPENIILKRFHFLLPHLLLFQDSFERALSVLSSSPIKHFPPQPDAALAKDLGFIALGHFSPAVGVKIGRPEYYKARSIKHCCRMIGNRRMSIERKYDGEYCQIHIDLSKDSNWIQIFSKSGKDSTADRAGIHQVISESLKLRRPGCKISRRCILEGEMLVWSDKHGNIADFHKLRKFISRSGTFIGTKSDSPPQPYEHLMIVFFDILLIDENVCLRLPHRERRLLLKDTMEPIPGRADISEQWVVDFSHHGGQSRLESIFYKGITERWEGFVLKACEDPYFTIFSDDGENPSFGRWIKLKKDYIPGLGDTVDLAIIGARYNARDAMAIKQVKKLSWTEFYIGCLVNKEMVVQSGALPKFRVLDVINHHCMHVRFMQLLNQFGDFCARSPDSEHGFILEYGESVVNPMEVVFKTPFVVEMLGSGFEKPSGARYYTLRFPRILKVLSDRSFEDAASYRELQLLAETARSVLNEDPGNHESEAAKRMKLRDRSECTPDRSQSLQTTQSPFLQSSTTAEDDSGKVAFVPLPNKDSNTPDALPGPARQTKRRRESSAMQRIIPIHVDLNRDPSPRTAHSVGGSYLTDNENLSSHATGHRKNSTQTTRSSDAEKASRPSQMPDPSSSLDKLQKHSELLHKPIDRQTESNVTLETCSNRLSGNETVTPHLCKKATQRIISPLLHSPIYIHHDISSDDMIVSQSIPDAWKPAQTLNKFVRTLTRPDTQSHPRIPNPHSVSHGTVYGLVMIPGKRDVLCTILPDLIKRIANALQSHHPTIHHAGKVFVLDSSFLRLKISNDDTRLCLRRTWEDISKVFFYACVSWTFKGPPGYNTPDQARECDALYTRPKITVSFDRRELGLLGENLSH
ncbi:hypothetical protein AtubIFM55763_011095 [Aspergillus tubingensis]|nr:hypothetical protein AtubIFM55763_011095 [Aspergillus tubingensis]